jgi:hypothetical protein
MEDPYKKMLFGPKTWTLVVCFLQVYPLTWPDQRLFDKLLIFPQLAFVASSAATAAVRINRPRINDL